ncbi:MULTISPECIES: type VI secretion system ATPase TssH [unclassified Motilimonas]|uniref:type VI secretion system ATPase TssH n=1 Tax=unclassified Motilimonas TaxID=2643697 RepID=UPI001E476E98|nr:MULTISPECIES: type VI secretion system ATPase TssH [unclassified Motilimonas]MCE0559224.1 type VI secretion system ATPase TssH [Motilimonas sp. E26]MDO6527515.1 type VI secretion system ATPase TssH [Motilimonas sp. 1_MG-2023]
MRVDLPKLIAKLTPVAKHALEQAAALSVSRQNRDVTVLHLLYSCLETSRCDVRLLVDALELDHDGLQQNLGNLLPQGDSHDTYPVFSPLLIELLQESWLLSSTELDQVQLRTGAIFLACLINAERYLPMALVEQFSGFNRETLRTQFNALTQGSSESAETGKKPASSALMSEESALLKYSTNFTQLARDGELDPVLCRDNEIDLMIDILCRRRKNNPIVVGDAGVGKSAVVEGLAQRIADGLVPEQLSQVSLLALDLGLLQAGASVKGEFEKRLKAILEEVKNSPEPIILFIDEAHTLIGAGNQEGGGDAANLLKPALARGEVRTVGATTWKEYKKYFEKDPALARRFQLVKLEEPSIDASISIMRGLHQVYEQAHGVLISDKAVKAAAELSARYVSGRLLPDKAIDVLDTACARIAINLTSPPRQLAKLNTLNQQLQAEIELLERDKLLGQFDDAEYLAGLISQLADNRDQASCIETDWLAQKALVENLVLLRSQFMNEQHTNEDILNQLKEVEAELALLQADRLLIHPWVDEKQVAQVIADWTGVPVNQMNTDELSKITQLPAILGAEVKGQQPALNTLHKHLLTARADLRRAGRPKGAFLLVGPSGVGKTETVVQIAHQLYGGKQFLTTINMSEYQEKHTVSRLIGSPPGYVGFGEGGVLTEAIRKKPYSVVLLDEVEKAHPEVLNLFYQAFDKGELADGEGRIIDCQNIVFFLTSNLGYQTIVDHHDDEALMKERLYPELAAFFKPALLARMETVPYLPLAPDVLIEIAQHKLNAVKQRLVDRYKAQVELSDSLVDEICRRATRSENGARMLEAIIDGQLLPPLSQVLLDKMAADEAISFIGLSCDDAEFVCTVE